MFYAILSAQKNFHPKSFWVKQGATQCYQAFLVFNKTENRYITLPCARERVFQTGNSSIPVCAKWTDFHLLLLFVRGNSVHKENSGVESDVLWTGQHPWSGESEQSRETTTIRTICFWNFINSNHWCCLVTPLPHTHTHREKREKREQRSGNNCCDVLSCLSALRL